MKRIGAKESGNSMPGNQSKQAPEESTRSLFSRYEAILAAVPDIIMEVDTHKVYTWANRAGINFFGNDVIGRDADFYFEGKQETYNMVQPLFEGSEDTVYLESWQRRKDGKRRLLGWWCKVLKDEKGNVTGALSTARDITENKQANIALAESEERFRNVFEHASVGKSITSLDGGIRVNGAFCQMLGYSKEQLSNLKWQEITYRDDVERDKKIIDAVISRERDSARWEKRYIHKGGETVWGDISTVLQCDCAGKPLYLISTVIDITERKRAEEELRKSEKRLREAQEMAHLGYWNWDVKTGKVEWSEQVFTIFHLDAKTFTPHIDSILALSPWPEDHQRDQELIKKAMETHTPGFYEQKFLRPDQSIGHYYSTFQGNYDDNGDLISIVGTVLDITERKRADEAVKVSELRYRRLFEAARDGILILDADTGMVVDVNPFLMQLLGYSRDVFLGRKIWELGFFKDTAANKVHLSELLQKEFIQYEDMPLETAGGQLINVEFVSHVYEVDRHKVIQCNIRDITARKLVEEKTLLQLDELRRWQEVTLGREDRIRQLKSEVNQLLVQRGEPARYQSLESASDKQETAKG